MNARVTLLLLTLAVSAGAPPVVLTPIPDVVPQDSQPESEPQQQEHVTVVAYFNGQVPDLLAEAETPGGPDLCDLLTCNISDPMRAAPLTAVEAASIFDRPALIIPQGGSRAFDVTSEEFFDASSREYIVKDTYAVPLPESDAFVLKLQADERLLAGKRIQAFNNGAIGSGTLGVEGRWPDPNHGDLEIGLTYRYDLSRPSGIAASLKYPLPDFLAPLHLYAGGEAQTNVDGSDQEKLSLSAWSNLPRGLRMSGATWTATVGVQRADAFTAGPHLQQSYGLSWGALLKLSERFSAGMNMSYTWDANRLGTFFYLELRAPARKLPSPGGFYELEHP